MASDITVTIKPDGDGFSVVLDPPDDRHPPQHFDDVRKARGMAGGLRLVLGARKIDLTGEA